MTSPPKLARTVAISRQRRLTTLPASLTLKSGVAGAVQTVRRRALGHFAIRRGSPKIRYLPEASTQHFSF